MQSARVQGRTVIVRVDYNVETKNGRLRDLTRLTATVPTLRWLLRQGASIILVSHRGRPKGKTASLSLRPCVQPLSKLIHRSVRFVASPIGSPTTKSILKSLKPGQVVLLENIRFEPGEEKNAAGLARLLAGCADLYVNDAFAVSHRPAASVVAISKHLPSYAGLLMQAEVEHLEKLLRAPRRPFVAVLGGAKLSTKLPLIQSLLRRADFVLLGGAMANTILAAQGQAIGKSLDEPGLRRSIRRLSVANRKLKIPVDVVVATSRTARRTSVRAVGNVGAKEIILDLGPDTVALYRKIILSGKTVVWNGPMGVFELPQFAAGTTGVARAVAANRGYTVVGGGETIEAIGRLKLTSRYSFVSTGGGAMLEFLEGTRLPGLQPLLV